MLLLATVAAAGTALAQGGDDFRKKEAEERYKEGLTLHEKGREEEARVKFEQAYAALKRPNILFSLARSEQLTGRPVEAITHYRMFLADAKDPKFRTLASDNLATLYRDVGRLEITAPEGVKVTVDGEVASEAMLKDSVPVKPGSHVVVGQSGEKKFEKKVTVTAGEVLKVSVVLESAPAPAPTPSASTAPAPTTTTSAAVPAPSSSGYTYTPPPKDDPEKPGMGRWIGPIALGVVGAAGVGGGIFFGLQSAKATDDANAIAAGLPKGACAGGSPSCTELQDKADKADKNRTYSYVSYIAGGAFLAGATVWTVLNLTAGGKSGRTRVVPMVGVGGGGAVLEHTF